MTAKIMKITAILIVTFAVLNWLRSDGYYDFDIRSVIPFMRGPYITIHDWIGVVMIILGVWGIARLYQSPRDDGPEPVYEDDEDEYEVVEDEPEEDDPDEH